MRVIYVVGPYRAETEYQVTQNIAMAEALAVTAWLEGFAVICPHKNSSHFGGLCSDEVFLEGYKEILRRCDGALTCWGWQNSEGSIAEVKLANELGIPVASSIRELKGYLPEEEGEEKEKL